METIICKNAKLLPMERINRNDFSYRTKTPNGHLGKIRVISALLPNNYTTKATAYSRPTSEHSNLRTDVSQPLLTPLWAHHHFTAHH